MGMFTQFYHSVWVLFWAVYGGIAMVLLTWVALDYLPWRGHVGSRQPLWVYSFPLVLFLTCLSPYMGLKTESSIAMFSNLHTEGGVNEPSGVRQAAVSVRLSRGPGGNRRQLECFRAENCRERGQHGVVVFT